MPSISDAELSELVELSTKLLQLLDSEHDLSHSEVSSIPTIMLTTPSGQEMDIDTAPSWRDVQLPAHLVNRDKGSGHANGNSDGNGNDGKEKSMTPQPIVRERMTGHDHLRVKKTIKKIRRKVQGINGKRVGEIETRGGNDTEGLSLGQPDASDKTTL
ncbi:hypothetical protein N5P37_002327 [Trichoderma harzianum]|uniref:Uncharacterized protein n=1 Tax=Trichoderma harzianum CBS 226.95 TaxID=983964 RepID=A0A2T4AF19_TRIHA|nr:hypothetical protein M431DRAFT_507345 [Trichoderma harzianum CBS 226.95]KAK0764855.1 hypothetical protein N5P37_002327 [Trichoderma harzianum]PTB55681.1 hypothetical protein M431DRAFT_507345 [Trichoderma harzianum CBS 226.95]